MDLFKAKTYPQYACVYIPICMHTYNYVGIFISIFYSGNKGLISHVSKIWEHD